MSGGGIKVGRRRGYTHVWNDLLPVDGSLSARAWGVYVYLIGRPEGWETSSRHLATVFREGRDSIRSALHELVDAGLMEIETTKIGNLPVQRFSIPDEDSHGSGFQAPENPAQVTTDLTRADPRKYAGRARRDLSNHLKHIPTK